MIFVKGKKIILRAIERNDLKYFVKWLNDEEVIEGLAFICPISMVEEEKWYENYLKDESTKQFMIQTKDNKIIGSCSLNKIDWRNRRAEIGIFIGEKKYWNQGYGKDAIITLLEFAFAQMNFHKIYLHVFEYNKRAIECYKKCGFKEEGNFREEFYKFGKYYNQLRMGILRDEFEKIKK